MLRCLLLEELVVLALGDDLDHAILSCRLVDIVPMIDHHDECDPQTPL
jgi:hypothetical protein